MRILHAISYLCFIIVEIIQGSVRLTRLTFSRQAVAEPAIVEYKTQARTDLEITLLASSITITPGTLVLGVSAAAEDGSPSLFVHSMFDRADVFSGLNDLEARLLKVTRKTVTQ